MNLALVILGVANNNQPSRCPHSGVEHRAEEDNDPYADVEKVQGSGLSKGAKVGIIVGVAVVTVAVVIAAGLKSARY